MSEEQDLVNGSARPKNAQPDWGRFGLATEHHNEGAKEEAEEHDAFHGTRHEKNELFGEDLSAKAKPWYRTNFFVSEPVLFGTWDGVFTSCMINIFGVVIFLRTGWMVGNAGIGFSVLIIILTICVSLISAMSAIGVCERCKMESGGVYFLLSHVLGARQGAAVGILYCFGQAVACSLYVVGFGESISSLIAQGAGGTAPNEWISRGIAIGVVVLLLGINVAGVKWVIRLQLVLLMVLFIAMLDFLVGSFVHTDPEHGVLGYNHETLANNTHASYLPGESFFTVFGVFFPTACGVFAGINMSGDLKNPGRSIPVGTLSAVGVSTLLYLSFAIVLGATCVRHNLQTDYMIAEKVSVVGVLFLAGLYISSVSSSMGAIYGAPRILQCIANENVIPVAMVLGRGVAITHFVWIVGSYVSSLSCALGTISGSPRILQAVARSRVIEVLTWLGRKRGPNKVPVYALVVIFVITMIFIFVGNVNTLGPIVTMPFLITYAAVDYAYFALAMSFDTRSKREQRMLPAGGGGGGGAADYGAVSSRRDLEQLFPERVPFDQRKNMDKVDSPTFVKADQGHVGPGDVTADEDAAVKQERKDEDVVPDAAAKPAESEDTAGLLTGKGTRLVDTEITRQPRSFYSVFCNRWLSLFGVVISLVIMIATQWAYALANIAVLLMIYFYIGQANPGVFPGIAEFSFISWITTGVKNCCRRGSAPQEQIIVQRSTPAMSTTAAQLTADNEDFASRGRYHQSEVVKGENFDDYQ